MIPGRFHVLTWKGTRMVEPFSHSRFLCSQSFPIFLHHLPTTPPPTHTGHPFRCLQPLTPLHHPPYRPSMGPPRHEKYKNRQHLWEVAAPLPNSQLVCTEFSTCSISIFNPISVLMFSFFFYKYLHTFHSLSCSMFMFHLCIA
jgi:hypothetical protein